jgi:hypothetical protein
MSQAAYADELGCTGDWLCQRVLGTLEEKYDYDIDRDD